MLKAAWYVITHVGAGDGSCDLPRLDQAPELMAMVDRLFGADSNGDFSPAHTGTATRLMLRMAEHLSDAIRHGDRAVADRPQCARLIHDLNLLLAYTAQLSGRLAHQVDTGTGADLSALPAREQAVLTTALATACCRLEEAAGLFKEAHLAVDSVVSRARRD